MSGGELLQCASSTGFAFAMSSHVGRRRKRNEDWCAASVALGAFVVCDGMGGAARGEVASRMTCESFLARLGGFAQQPGGVTVRTPSAAARLGQAIRAANRAVYRRAEEDAAFHGMGTTLVALLLDMACGGSGSKPRVAVAHVGDSRCYRLRGGRLERLTRDHSVVEEQMRAGQISWEDARRSPMRHLITRAVGARARIEPEVRRFEAVRGDLFLLASDGLNRELGDEQIEGMLGMVPDCPSAEELGAACEGLIEAVNGLGGRDNVTVLLVAIA